MSASEMPHLSVFVPVVKYVSLPGQTTMTLRVSDRKLLLPMPHSKTFAGCSAKFKIMTSLLSWIFWQLLRPLPSEVTHRVQFTQRGQTVTHITHTHTHLRQPYPVSLTRACRAKLNTGMTSSQTQTRSFVTQAHVTRSAVTSLHTPYAFSAWEKLSVP